MSLTRDYGQVDGRYKDGGSVLLMKGESPRTPYPWRKYNCCPHCGSKGYWNQNDRVGSCKCCGTWLFAPVIPEMPLDPSWIRDEAFVQAGGNPLVDAVCEKCGATYRTYARRPAKWCCRCRQAQYRRNYKERVRRERHV